MHCATVGRNALNRRSSEKQEAAMLAAGHRVITYYRRGFGASSRPSVGYEIRHAAADLHVLLSRLRLRVVLVGTGEVTRCLAVHGAGRVRAAVLAAPPRPFPAHEQESCRCRPVVRRPLAGTGTRNSVTVAAIRPLPSGPGERLAGRQGRYLPSDPWRRAAWRSWPGRLPGDQVELVAFDVGEGRPARLA